MSIRIIAPPAAEPVALEDAKLFLRVDHDDEDALISGLVRAARERVVERRDNWHVRGPLSLGPVGAVHAVRALDAEDVAEVIPPAAYHADLTTAPARAQPVRRARWPRADQAIAIEVEYEAGYRAEPEDVPEGLRQAVWEIAAATYERGGAPGAVDAGSAAAARGDRSGRAAGRRVRRSLAGRGGVVGRGGPCGSERAGAGGAAVRAGRTGLGFVAGARRAMGEGNRVQVRLYHGALSSHDRVSALAGGNLLAVEGPGGEWEILIAREAGLVEPGLYELGGLLRGLCGTEGAMAAPVSAGARVVVLDGAPVPLPLLDHERRAPLLFGAGAGRSAPGDTHFELVEAATRDLMLRPLAPAHLRGKRVPQGVRLSWTRRSRIGGDSWGAADIPLGEEAEAYEVEILSGGQVALTLPVQVPQALLSLAQEAAIFGGPVWSFDVRVYQRSQSYGRGAPAARTLYLTP